MLCVLFWDVKLTSVMLSKFLLMEVVFLGLSKEKREEGKKVKAQKICLYIPF